MLVSPFETHLRNGAPVLVREVGPADRAIILKGFESLSEESRYSRYRRQVSRLTDEELDEISHEADASHEAVGAADISGGGLKPAGLARYIRFDDRSTIAEVAVTVIDAYHGQGVGTLLLGVLSKIAVRRGIKDFVALVHRDNASMGHVFKGMGGFIEHSAGGEYEYRIPLHADPSRYPPTRTGDTVRQAYALAEWADAHGSDFRSSRQDKISA